ncbi:MAG: ATP-binding cassette domain-containing protein [Elstera sp.]
MASLIATGLVPALIGLVPILGFGAALFLRRWQGAKAQVLGAEQRSAERSGLINETATLLLAVAGIAVLIVGVGARLQSIRGISDRLPEEQYVAAAQDARIHDFISSRPGGYASVLMENGNNLSGGERQRLALARALTINPRILVLDEATSALDPVTEAAVMEAIWRRGCACIVIAHRLSSIMDSDMILVMDKGRVVEIGSHQAAILPGSIWPRSAVKSGTCGRGGRLFSGCLRDNIQGAFTADLEDIWRAAEIAGIADDIRALPMGMHTVVTDGAAAFSARFYRAIALFMATRMRSTVEHLGQKSDGKDLASLDDDEVDDQLLDTVHLAGQRFEMIPSRLGAHG